MNFQTKKPYQTGIAKFLSIVIPIPKKCSKYKEKNYLRRKKNYLYKFNQSSNKGHLNMAVFNFRKISLYSKEYNLG